MPYTSCHSPTWRLCHNVILRPKPKNLGFKHIDLMRFFTKFILCETARFFAEPVLSLATRFFAEPVLSLTTRFFAALRMTKRRAQNDKAKGSE